MIIADGVVSSIKTMADGSIRIQIDLGVVLPNKVAALYGEYLNKEGAILITDPDSMENFRQIILESVNSDPE